MTQVATVSNLSQLAQMAQVAQPLPVRQLPKTPNLPPLTCPAPAGDRLQLQTATGAIPAVAPLFGKVELGKVELGKVELGKVELGQDEPALPPIEVEHRDNFTYYRNAFGVQITQVDYPAGKYFYALSSQGLGIMLRQHDDKRDTLDFTDMNFNISKPSQMPNVYFHVEGDKPSTLSFNARHEVVVDLSNGDQLKFDRNDGQTPLQGPVSLRFFPEETGQNFDAIYCGSDQTIKRYKSKGDTIQW